MSQHDFNIANQTAAPARADINSALTALASLSSGATAPSTTVANMLWYDTANDTLKLRNEADSGWISIGYADQSSGAFALFDNAKVVNTSGTQTGLIGDQATSAWEAGTSTTESLVSPAKVKAAVEANSTFGSSVEYNLGLMSAGTGSASHGLGAYPSLVSFYIECVSSDGGYSVGDRVSFIQAEQANSVFNGISGWYSASSVGFAAVTGMLMVSKSAGGVGITGSRWRVYARVWA